MERSKPDIEMDSDDQTAVFCGACGQIMFVVHGTGCLEKLRKTEKTCWHCGVEIDWEPKEVKK